MPLTGKQVYVIFCLVCAGIAVSLKLMDWLRK